MRVVSSENGSSVTLPAEYVREYVALGYALTIHKAQGQTTERAIVLVDNHMSAAQLYVAMSRGRQENRAFVISSDEVSDDHVRRPSVDTVELLTGVMRRDELDRSAHDEMRRSLARYEDLALLDDLLNDAALRIDREAGPDRRRRIASLEQRAKVDEATRRLEAAHQAIRIAKEQTAEATALLAEVEREPIRARLPGRIGADARERFDRQRGYAKWSLESARREEQQALRCCDEARHRLDDAQNAAKELSSLREAQARRDSWMREHPDEVCWARDLRERIEARTLERFRFPARSQRSLGTERVPDDGRPSRSPRASQPDDASAEPRNRPRTTNSGLDPATEAVLRRSRRTTTPEPWRPPPEREGPVLGR